MTPPVPAMRSVGLVAGREFTERLRSRAYQVSTAITLLVVAALLVLPGLLASPTEYTVAVTGEVPDGLGDGIVAGAADPGTTVTVDRLGDAGAVRAAVTDGQADVGLVDGTTVVVGPDTPPELEALVTVAAAGRALTEAAQRLDVSPETLGELLGAAPTVDRVEPDDAEEQRTTLAFVGTLVLFVSIVTYGQWVLQGVVEEKSSRVVEVVLGAVAPRHLLAGKVIGIGALGLIQVLLIAVTGLVAARFAEGVELPAVTVGAVAVVLAWFVLGFALYASGYAVAGSLVSNNEDAQNASFPLTLLLMAGYFVSAAALGGGADLALLRVLSIVPPFSPMVMPLRQVAGEAVPWEVGLAVVLMLAAIVLMIRIGGRVYSGALLRTGGRAKVRDAFRGAET